MLNIAALLLSLTLSLSAVPRTQAAIAWGTVQPRDWPVTYDTATYDSTLKFCQAWRLACIDYVGSRNYHHSPFECDISQPGPTVYTICAGVKKDPNGDFGNGPPSDFTTFMVGTCAGATLSGSPKEPMTPYAGDGVANAAVSSSSSSAVVDSSSTSSSVAVESSSSISFAQVSSTSSSESVDIVTITSAAPSSTISLQSASRGTVLAAQSSTRSIINTTSSTSDAASMQAVKVGKVLSAVGVLVAMLL